MDLNLPPPSYEAATGAPQKPTKPHFHSASPSAPPPSHGDDIISAPATAPILPQPYRSSPRNNIRPYNPISYPVASPSPQTNNILRREQSKNDSKICVCFFITLAVLVVMVVIFVIVGKASSAKTHKYSDHLSTVIDNNNNGRADWEEKWWKDNKEYLDNLQKRTDELLKPRPDYPNWNFQNNPN